MYLMKSLGCLTRKSKPVTQKVILPNTQLLRKDLGDSETYETPVT